MVNLVPILFLAPFAYLILRLAIGSFWIFLAYRHLTQLESLVQKNILFVPRQVAVVLIIMSECIIGTLFVLGAYTQLAALMSIIFIIKIMTWRKFLSMTQFPPASTWFFVIAVSIALFITGAGPFGFDLPI
jgi:uncharacterized membrane protein YphA (DoxX/SURF4 family)